MISNASDALDKIRFLSLTDKSALEATEELSIKIKADKEAGVLHVTDTGIGKLWITYCVCVVCMYVCCVCIVCVLCVYCMCVHCVCVLCVYCTCMCVLHVHALCACVHVLCNVYTFLYMYMCINILDAVTTIQCHL